MQLSLSEKLQWIADSTYLLVPELILCLGIILLLILGLFKKTNLIIFQISFFLFLIISGFTVVLNWPEKPVQLFNSMLRADDFSSLFKILFCVAGIITGLMTRHENLKQFKSEYFLLVFSVILGANLMVMSMNFVMLILSLELISISSYVLAGFTFTKKGSEGSLKYFLFGSVATAIMIYGISLIFGLAGTLNFASRDFVMNLIEVKSPLLVVAGLMILTGFLFKITAAPFHIWAPDVYESSPTPIVAFFSVVPKLAGLGALVKFTMAINLFGQSAFDWQLILATIAILTLTIGNFSALWQKNAKRMMAYSSIAQTGFLLIGLTTLSLEGTHFLIFYAAIFMLSNFLIFIYLQQFERDQDALTVQAFAGLGKMKIIPAIYISIGLISLTGLPPTAGFTSKFLVFSSLWNTYAENTKTILLVLFAFGLINTVVALFFYLKIPYYLFMKTIGPAQTISQKNRPIENLLGTFLVVLVILLFFLPGLLMGWINRINFVL